MIGLSLAYNYPGTANHKLRDSDHIVHTHSPGHENHGDKRHNHSKSCSLPRRMYARSTNPDTFPASCWRLFSNLITGITIGYV